MLPSLVCLVGLRLPQILSVILIILYLVLMLWMGLMFLSGLHGQIDYSLARAGVILVVAKSIYGVCMVTKQFD